MKLKLFFFLVVASFWFKASLAQTKSARLNSFSIGYGLGTWGGSVIIIGELEPNYTRAITGPIYLKYEKAISGKIGFGVNFSYADYEMGYSYYDPYPDYYSKSDTYSTFSVLARFNMYFPSSEGFEPYVGVGLGYRYAKMTYETGRGYLNSYTIIDSPMGFEASIGTRIYFTDNFGMYVEFGAAKSILQTGLTYKF